MNYNDINNFYFYYRRKFHGDEFATSALFKKVKA